LKKEFVELARTEIRKTICTPVKVLRMMDLKGGQVNFARVGGGFREIDTQGISACVMQSFHPKLSSSALQRLPSTLTSGFDIIV
jgi:hypothetical protein